jgi:cytochrome c peroxidase
MLKFTINRDWFRNGNNRLTIVTMMVAAMVIVASFSGCQKDPIIGDTQPFQTTPYELKRLDGMPPMPIPADNPLTVEGVELGKKLFYDPILSGDNTQSCASCHQQDAAFVDKDKRFSIGIDGKPGSRNSMPLMNVGYGSRFFWDGRAESLEDLIRIPIEDELEMHEDLSNAIAELNNSAEYRSLFKSAFGDETITVDHLSKAVAQFLRTLVGGSQVINGPAGQFFRDERAERGYRVFIDEEKGDCFHCHEVTVLNSTFGFENNGLADPNDLGLFEATGNPADKGKFKVPSLYHLNLTAPYMHDGRFNTLEEVIEHYDTGFVFSETLNANLKKHTLNGKPVPRKWTEQEKADLIYFLEQLRDERFLTNPEFQP